jgi:tRNA dimethylallyltransferase
VEREVIVIVGPTASGKTSLSIEVASQINTEIISADSRQFYRELNIGTAKPSSEDLKRVKHHFINFLDPLEDYNISRFREEALIVCEKLWSKGQIPVITGGSGLYIKALIDGISNTPDPDPELRERLMKEKELYGADYLYNKLRKIDPVISASMIPQNWKRVIRALEVYYIMGRPISEVHKDSAMKDSLSSYQFGIMWDRKVLYDRINTRVDEMIRVGFVDEVRELLQRGFNPDSNSFNTVGYKEIVSFLKEEISFEKAVELIKRNTRRYAKRQLTWFRKDARIHWETIKSNEELYIFAERIVNQFNSNRQRNQGI